MREINIRRAVNADFHQFRPAHTVCHSSVCHSICSNGSGSSTFDQIQAEQHIALGTAWTCSVEDQIQAMAALDLTQQCIDFLYLTNQYDTPAIRDFIKHLKQIASGYLIRKLGVRCSKAERHWFENDCVVANQQSEPNVIELPISGEWSHYQQRIYQLHRELSVADDYACQHALPLQDEAEDLVAVGEDIYQRPQQMAAKAAQHWHSLQQHAQSEGIDLAVVSAFRSVDYQTQIIRHKQQQGQSSADIFKVSAAPGFSEHHTGRALDLTTQDSPVLEETFAETIAYRWLQENASDHGFYESFPRDNPHRLIWEPWHWAWRDDAA